MHCVKSEYIYVTRFFSLQDVENEPSVIQGYQRGILTPTFKEFPRLYEATVRVLNVLMILALVSGDPIRQDRQWCYWSYWRGVPLQWY